MTKIGNY